MSATLDIEIIPQQSELLGRHKVHDERSRAFPMLATIDRSSWKAEKAVRLYEPWPNPNQRVGTCTGVGECNLLNAVGNRVKGRMLKMSDAETLYSWASANDPWPGQWPPEDTGSSGLAAAKASVHYGLAREYRWNFQGADGVVQSIMDGIPQSVGTYWDWNMFEKDQEGLIRPGGGRAGGHQYVMHRYRADRDWVGGLCWWGSWHRFWITRADLDTLLRDGGDSHFTRSV